MREAALATALAVSLLCPAPALAVVPVRFSPGQVLLALLPYLLGGLLALGLAGALAWYGGRALTALLRARGFRQPRLMVLGAGLLLLASAGGGLGFVFVRPATDAADPPPASSGPEGSWSTFMADAARTGGPRGARGPKEGRKAWTFRDGLSRAPFGASAAVVAGRVYVGSDNHKLYCLDARTGLGIWEFKAALEIFASPVVADGRVYLGEGLHTAKDARLYCLDADTGKPVWELPTKSHIEFSPTLFGGRLYLAAGEDGVYCVDPRDGRLVWRYEGVHVDMSPSVTEGGVFFGSVYGSPAFYALDPQSGALRWKRAAPLGVSGSPSTDGERVCFGLGNGTFEASHAQPRGAVVCLAADGRTLWQRDVPDAVLTTVALADGAAYFGCRDGRVYGVDAATGEVRWSFATQDAVVSSPAVAGGRVYFGSNDGNIYGVEARTGAKIWSYDTSNEAFNTDARVMASPAISDGRLYVGSMNFCFFSLGDGP